LALQRHDRAQIDRLLALIDVVPEAERAVVSAFGWASPATLRGFTATLLASADPLPRWLGLAACAAHRVDPGAALDRALDAADARERGLALQSAGVLGRPDRRDACAAHLDDDDARCRWHAAAAVMLLRGSAAAAQALQGVALAPGAGVEREAALRLHMLCTPPEAARQTVRELAADPARRRQAIQAAGWAGDLQALPWLLQQMEDPGLARAAGEAFALLTGADLAALDLEGSAPPDRHGQGPEAGEDDPVAMDDDESLPWPDVARVRAWWQAQGSRLDGGAGARCFMGAPVSAQSLLHVLRSGGQRQRAAAALLQVLGAPTGALFNVAAPAPRQQRLLDLATRVV
jgi:uncharacterized protein (TIGR02270 family)